MFGRCCILLAASLAALKAQPAVAVAPIDASIASFVTVVLPSDASFQRAVENMLPPAALPVFQPVLPYSVVVGNSSTIPIVGLVAYVDTVDGRGNRTRHLQGIRNVPPNDKDDFQLPPGQQRLLTVDAQYGQESVGLKGRPPEGMERRLKLLTKHEAQNCSDRCVNGSITFELDSILFADGKFAGPDKANAFGRYTDSLTTKAEFDRAVLALQGHSDGELQHYLATIAASGEGRRPDGSEAPARLARQNLAWLKTNDAGFVFTVLRNDLKRITDFQIHR